MMHLVTKASKVFLSTRTTSKDKNVYLVLNSRGWYWYGSIKLPENIGGKVMNAHVNVTAYSEVK